MAEFNQEGKEVVAGMSELNSSEDEMEQGIMSPVDCWELVGSHPGSPLPEARVDGTALEEAIASACNSGSLLQHNYFGCTDSQVDDEVLPVSTAMVDKQNIDEGHSSERNDDLVSLASDTDAIEDCAIHTDLMCHDYHVDNADFMCHDDSMHHDDYMLHNDTYHDDLPYCRNLISEDQVQHDMDACHHCRMRDEFMMYQNELMEHDSRCHIENEKHFEGITQTDGEGAHVMNQSGNSCENVESTAVVSSHHDVCALGLSSGLELASYSPMSSHGIRDSDMSMQEGLAEDSTSTVMFEEPGREATSEFTQLEDSVNGQHGTISTYKKGQPKGFVCASWIWNQLIRWQAQLGHANTIWSVALAAAVMGILVVRRGWQRLQAQNQSLRSQLWAKEKRITQLMFQLMQTKDSLAKVRRVPVICVKPSLQIPQDHI